MIIKQIEAENILKYRSLKLLDLPPIGQIAVVGLNESGKTAVGETICFALFGRTFSLSHKELDRIIRWGEFNASARLLFLGGDGLEYRIVRDVDNNGTHNARIYVAGEDRLIAEGVEAVAKSVATIGGFTFNSFVDSFYLAQREMEVPHAKSATVKALIGVDKLEAVASEMKLEISQTSKIVAKLDGEIAGYNGKIAEIKLDRAHLGRLEASRDEKEKAVANARRESAELKTRADAIGRASAGFTTAALKFVECNGGTGYGQWRERQQDIKSSVAVLAKASKACGISLEQGGIEDTGAAIEPFEQGLDEFDKVRGLAGLYRNRLSELLDDRASSRAGINAEATRREKAESSFADRRRVLNEQIEQLGSRRKPIIGLGIFFVELALICWIGWAVVRGAPDSAVAGWVRAVVALSDSARSMVLLITAIVSTLATGVFIGLHLHAARLIQQFEDGLGEVDQDEDIARTEIGVIDAINESAIPDTLEALRGVRNDLVSSAADAFRLGAGAILVQPGTLEEKLATIRKQSEGAEQSLKQGRQRIAKRAAERSDEADSMRKEMERLGAEVAKERKRWEQVEALERTVAGLATKANEHRHTIVVRNHGCELIDGACKRIYGRFHPELRRFIGKILPNLTQDRYEQLDIDDDLRVRVFSKEKNDFVGLEEISNGTHRQLMLCVRLALSQALIASTSRSSQFIFFDEPFVFFDEQRMTKAVDVLGRISPQITQVWLAAQRFEKPETFDMVIDCDVDGDCLEVSGRRPTQKRKKPVPVA